MSNVIHIGARLVGEIELVGEAQCEKAGAQRLLHWVADAEVRCKRQRREQLSEP